MLLLHWLVQQCTLSAKNNEISELRAPKIVVNNDRKNGKETALLVTKDTFKEIARNNQVKDEESKVEKGKRYIAFSLEGKNYRIIVDINQLTNTLGNTLLFEIGSLKEKTMKVSSRQQMKQSGINH